MSAVAVEITSPSAKRAEPVDLVDLVVVEDVEELTVGAVPGCNDDNPYR
ncbi:hypothetical protein [Streptomyces adelaidensis]|nr:hypothetical protein [Streptomyces adelaidensis]